VRRNATLSRQRANLSSIFWGEKIKRKFEGKKWAWPMGVARRWSALTDKKKREQRLFFQFKEKISSIAFFYCDSMDLISFNFNKLKQQKIPLKSNRLVINWDMARVKRINLAICM
jgi:transposase